MSPLDTARAAAPRRHAPVAQRLGFGTSHLHRVASSRERQNLLAAAFDEGIRHFDTARLYGYGVAEAELRPFLVQRRSQVTIASKAGFCFPGYAHAISALQRPGKLASALEKRVRARLGFSSGLDNLIEARRFTLRALEASLHASLRALGTEGLDVFFLHEPEPALLESAELLAWLERRRERGDFLRYGVAGERHRALACFREQPALCATIQCSAAATESADEALPGFAPHITYGHFRGAELGNGGLERRMREVLAKQRDGMILFSSTRIANVRGFVATYRKVNPSTG